MQIIELDIYRIRIPFKRKYVHAEAGREEADNIILRIRSNDWAIGIGETIPRTYLTGETASTVIQALSDTFAPRLLGAEFPSFEQVRNFLSELALLGFERSLEAAFCAVDLALLDLAGKSFSISVLDAIGGRKKSRINYTGPVSGEGAWTTAIAAAKLKLARFNQVKVKVGLGDDEARLSVVRKILGPGADIRIDANCAWQPEEAVEKIERLKPFNISSIEQPVSSNDVDGMEFVRERCGVPVMADESMCSVNDVILLGVTRACDIVNVRIAKCGGITGCLQVVRAAHRHGLKYQLGCLVGETSILGAAGRALAFAVPNFIHVEGSYNRHLLKSDIADPKLGFGFNGSAAPLEGYGLGVQLDERALKTWVVEEFHLGK